MGGLGALFLLRRARSSWPLLSCVAVTVLLATGLAAVLWTFAAGVVPAGALSILAAPQGRVIQLSGVAEASDAAADTPLISAALHKAWPGAGFQLESALWADPLQLGSSSVTNFVDVQPASMEGFTAHATLTAGTWPGPPRRGAPVPVALPAAAASRLHVTLGSVLTGSPQAGGTTSLRVTGFYQPKDPASTYWALDLLPVLGVSVHGYAIGNANSPGNEAGVAGTTTTYGPAVVNPAAFGGALAAGQASWLVLPQAAALADGDVGALSASTSAALAQLTQLPPRGLQVTSSFPQLLTGVASTVVLSRSLFTIAALELLLVAAAALVLAARLLASLREEESALLRARGATRWQVARPVLAEAVVVGAVTALVGVLAGSRLAGPLAHLGNLRLAGSGIPALAWLSALVMLVLCAAVMIWPVLRVLTPGAARHRRGRQARLAGIAWAGGDVALVALAAVAVWQLRDFSAVAHPATGSLGIDPVVAIAPALALAGVALIPLRGLPLLARAADKTTDHVRRLGAAMVSWQIARRPIRQAGPVLLVVVATATTTLGLTAYASWRQSAADQAAYTVGADVQVNSAGPLPLGASAAVARSPGVTGTTPASVTGIGNGSQLIALDATTARNTILLRSDLSPLPLAALFRRITPAHASGLTLPTRAGRLEITATLGAGPHSSAAGVRKALGTAFVTASVQDAYGAVYQVPAASPLPFDGRPHSLVFTLSGPQQASDPLRLTGLSLVYSLPAYEPSGPAQGPAVNLTVGSLAAAATASGPFGAPFGRGTALAAWTGLGTSPLVPTGPPNAFGAMTAANGVPPVVVPAHVATAGGEAFTFDAGQEPSAPVMADVDIVPGEATGEVTIAAPAPSPTIPAIATSGYLAANHLSVGSLTQVSLGGFTAAVQIVASVARFPTVSGQNQALIADLAEVNDVLTAYQVAPLPVTRWWLSTTGGRVPTLPAGLGLSVTSRASQQAALLGNELLTAPRQAMLAIGAAAVLLAVLGFSVSVAASLRSRRTQSAVFAALGVGKNAQAGQLCLEQCALSVPAAVAGLLAGIGLAELIVPAITLSANSAEPVPSVLVIVPLGLAVALAVVTAALPAVAAALSVLRRPDPAVQLRAEAA